jgi:hypothetical protein
MPYLRAERKTALDNQDILPTTTGDLTYLFTRALLGDPREATLVEALQAAVDRYFQRRQINFGLLCDVVGALTCAGFEYERRIFTRADEMGIRSIADAEATLRALREFIQEFYAHVVAPYENDKIKTNGDVFPT